MCAVLPCCCLFLWFASFPLFPSGPCMGWIHLWTWVPIKMIMLSFFALAFSACNVAQARCWGGTCSLFAIPYVQKLYFSELISAGSIHHVMWSFLAKIHPKNGRALKTSTWGISSDEIISSQLFGSMLQIFFTLGDGCWLPIIRRKSTDADTDL